MRGLLRVQVVLLDGFETVQGQVIVRLTEHSDLPRLELFHLRSHKSKVRLAVMTPVIAIGGVAPSQSPSGSDLVVRRSFVPFLVPFRVSC